MKEKFKNIDNKYRNEIIDLIDECLKNLRIK